MNDQLNPNAIVDACNDELEPIALATVSEVTGAADGGSGDPLDNIVWGNE